MDRFFFLNFETAEMLFRKEISWVMLNIYIFSLCACYGFLWFNLHLVFFIFLGRIKNYNIIIWFHVLKYYN